MAIQLDPNSLNNDINRLNLSTVPLNKLRRVQRVKDDLDHYYIETEAKSRAHILNLPYIDLYGFPIDTVHLLTFSRAEAENGKIGVFTMNNREVYLATPEPGHDGQEMLLQKLITAGLHYRIYLCSPLSFDKLMKTYGFVIETKSVSDDISISEEKINQQQGLNSLQNLGQLLDTISVSEVIETILSTAIQNDASDIHFEPEKDTYVLRLRLDGVLHTFATLPKSVQKTIESRLKVVSGLKLNIDNIPQDGRFSFKANNHDIDVRVSMLPSNYGYSIVMRLLGTGSVALELNQLGFSGLSKERIQAAVAKPQGMILTTGPTGSGKTTTLYTFLQNLDDGESKIITLEDPIEYKLPGISQTQIDAKAGYTFALGLRSILRQDPDVVMIGEIRDAETAEIAVQAALTGHQVLSTLHTNDAAGAIPRMMEMDVKGFLLADSLSAVIGQRLVRRLCQHCKVPDHLDDKAQQIVMEQLSKIPASAKVQLPPQLNFYTATGCTECNGLGYKGRVGAYEVMTITVGLRNLLSDRFPSITQVRDVATQEGMVSMFQDALLKALDGLTDVKEILRSISY